MYVYEACVFKDEDGVLCANFPDFKGCITDGRTMEELVGNVKEALELEICYHLDKGLPLPKPTFHDPDDPGSYIVMSVMVDQQMVEMSKCLTVGQAADSLGVSKARVSQLLNTGQLQCVYFGNERLVTISSVNERLANPRSSGRPKKME